MEMRETCEREMGIPLKEDDISCIVCIIRDVKIDKHN